MINSDSKMLSQMQVMKKNWDETFLLVSQKIATLRQLCKVYIIAKNIETETPEIWWKFCKTNGFWRIIHHVTPY